MARNFNYLKNNYVSCVDFVILCHKNRFFYCTSEKQDLNWHKNVGLDPDPGLNVPERQH